MTGSSRIPLVLVAGTVLCGTVVAAVAAATGAVTMPQVPGASVLDAPPDQVDVGTAPGDVAGPTGAATLTSQSVATGPNPTVVADRTWVEAVAAVTGIPVTAQQAYGDATLALGEEEPACHLGWTTLAAVGAVESGHGTHGGATLRDDGHPSVPVVGPALDGTAGTLALPATPDGTAWHGDATWEHAVGPMQFLPQTWQRWAADGDHDGTADPHDIEDAALAAGRYLCAGDRDLAAAAGWRAAVLSYNRDEAYLQHVLELADAYADASAAVP